MSMRLKSCSLLAIAASGLLISAAPASAETLYAGGGTLAFGLYRTWADCFGQVLDSSRYPSRYPGTGKPTECQSASPVFSSALIAYAPVGSGAGVSAVIAQSSPTATPSDTPFVGTGVPSYPYPEFDFGGSDATLTTANLAAYAASTGPQAARGPAVQIPSVGSPVAIPYNTTGLTFPATRTVPAGAKTATGGSGKLYLSRKSYCGIFTGAITNWNNGNLTTDNRGTALNANKAIKVIVRADSSGTTFLLSRHLATVCDGSTAAGGPTFAWTGGVGTTVTWPSTFTAATGSKGVADAVVSTDGAIGYVSPDYTEQVATPQTSPAPVTANLQTRASFEANQPATTVKPIPPAPTYTQNAVTAFVAPTTNTAANWSTALDTTAMRNPANLASGTNPEAYPISGFTMLDLYTCYFPAAETNTLIGFVNWFTTAGSSNLSDVIARNNGFAPLTDTIKSSVRTYATTGTTAIKTGPVSGTCTISSGT